MPQPMISLPGRRSSGKAIIIPLPVRIRDIPRPAQEIENRLPHPPSNPLTRRSIQLPAVENRQVPHARIVHSCAVRFKTATALAPDADPRSVDVRPGLFAGVRVNPVYGCGEGGGVFAEVVGVQGRVVDGIGFWIDVDGACGDCESAMGGYFAEERAEGGADW